MSKQYKDAREAGSGVRLYMIAHELIHTLGLTNAAHSRDDVFTRDPGFSPKAWSWKERASPRMSSGPTT